MGTGRDSHEKPGDVSAVPSDEELETLSDTGSDAFIDEEAKAKEKQCKLLESMSAAQELLVDVNWAALKNEKREVMVGDFTHRLSPAVALSRVGIPVSLAGEELVQRIQRLCSEQEDSCVPSAQQQLSSILWDTGFGPRVLTARRDMALRAKLKQLPNQGSRTSQPPPPVDLELYQAALSIYHQRETDESRTSRLKLVPSKVGSLLINV